jgi:hypothetical protein
MINNFISHGINPNDIHILCAIYGQVPEDWKKLQEVYKDVKFFFYSDTRENRSYVPSIYFNMMKQHIKAYPELQYEPLFLHDCDIILTKPIDFTGMLHDKVWYLSNTVGYISTDYILSKGEDVYLKMCEVIGIDPLIPKLMNSNSGGAQHLVKNSTYEYWDKVEKDSIKLYAHLCEEEPKWTRSDYPLQKWTAGMWSLLWNAWIFGHETKVDARLDFCWATCSIDRWDTVSIFHNAGVTDDRTELFYKGKYILDSPYSIKKEDFSDKFCSFKYVESILKTKEVSCLV